MKNRTIDWIEIKIVKILSKQEYVQSYLALSSLVLENVRSFEEQKNLDVAIKNLLDRKIIKKYKKDYLTTYQLID